jgi:hypothetical protein
MYVNSLKLNNNQTHNLNCVGYSCASLQMGMREGREERERYYDFLGQRTYT